MAPASAQGPPYAMHWLEQARIGVRRPSRATAMRIFDGILHFATTGSRDPASLPGSRPGTFRLPTADYRVLSALENNALLPFGLRHRSKAYR
jgi:hypothetical protein